MDTENLIMLSEIDEKIKKVSETMEILGGGVRKLLSKKYGKLRIVNGYKATIEGEGVVEWLYYDKMVGRNVNIPYVIDDGKTEIISLGSDNGMIGGTGLSVPVELEFKKKIAFHVNCGLFYRLKE